MGLNRWSKSVSADADLNATRTVEFFSRFASDWGTFYSADGRMQMRLGSFLYAMTQWLPKGAIVLDFGCGTGDLTRAMRESGYDAFGIDASPKMIAFARERHPEAESYFSEIKVSGDLPVADNSCDAVIASSVLEYLPKLSPVISEFNRILRPHGLVFATVPNPRHCIRRIENRAQRLLLNRFGIWLSARCPWFLRRRLEYLTISVNRFDISRWEQIFRAGGFTLLTVEDSTATLLMLIFQKSPDSRL